MNVLKTVMVVDDFIDAREMMKILIEAHGYLVIEAVDGEDAIEKSAAFHPNLIFMDLAMPVMDGTTATKRIREIVGNENVSIIALTGFSNTSFEKAAEAGFDGVLHKPLHTEMLEPVLNYYLS